MTAPNLYTGGFVVVDDTVDIVLAGIIQQSNTNGIVLERSAKSGEVYPRHQSVQRIKPVFGFVGKSINEYIDALGIGGFDISSLATGIVSFQTQLADGGDRTAGANHSTHTYKTGVLYPMSINVAQDGSATMEYGSVLSHDGSNLPVIPGTSATLPTAPAETEFGIGNVQVAGIVLTGGIQSMRIDFAISVEGIATDGEVYDTHVSVRGILTSVTWNTLNIEKFSVANIGLAGKEATHANTIFYLRKREEGGEYVADGTAEHIKFTSAGIVRVEDVTISGEDGGESSINIVLDSFYDGTNLPITVNTTSAIT